ncbi:hypothetical protein M0R72_17110 [Candidatus Pacearchaeota archaeon]|jgi:hypothetical protein|nr:hypothetical protein [Candidatus Pacearchaeota archaeon]
MATNEEKIVELGWLDEGGLCTFPEDVKACALGFKSPTLPVAFFAKATEAQIQQAIDKGWIKFIDGNGEAMTFDQYVARYPDYPDPVFQLTLRGTFPPQTKRFYQIGGKR